MVEDTTGPTTGTAFCLGSQHQTEVGYPTAGNEYKDSFDRGFNLRLS